MYKNMSINELSTEKNNRNCNYKRDKMRLSLPVNYTRGIDTSGSVHSMGTK